jgi:Ricin-type beta-trefoil lectin domain
VTESNTEQPDDAESTKGLNFVRAFAANVRSGEKRSVSGRVVVIGAVVVLAGAVAFGIGTMTSDHHGNAAAAAERSPATGKRTPVTSSSPSPSLVVLSPKVRLPSGRTPGVDVTSPRDRNQPPGSPRPHNGTMYQKSAQGQSIVSYASNRCIDLINGQRDNGTPLQIWDCGGVSWQKWIFEPDNTVRTGGKCMTAVGGSASGTPIEIEDCNGGAAQRFVLKKSLDLVNIAADKCVDVKDKQTANGTRLQLWTCKGTSNQKWHAA